MTREQTRQIQRELLGAYLKAVDLELALRQQGRRDAANRARRRADALRREVDHLRALAWRQWRGRAEALRDEIRASNRRLQRAIRAIERSAERLEGIARALALLDEVIRLAAGIAGRA